MLVLLRHTLDQLDERDVSDLFKEPVDSEEVPEYYDVIKAPMDLRTMREKVESHEYTCVDEFEADFELMIRNCLEFNDKETTFYKQGIRMRDQGGVVLRAARRMSQRIGFDPDTGLHMNEQPTDVSQLLSFDDGS